MLIKLKILQITKRYIEKINKDVYEAKVQDANNKIYEKVTLWVSDWPQELPVGEEIMAEIKYTEKNGFKNTTLYPERTQGFSPPGGYPKRSNNIAQAMEKKDASIGKFQDNKEHSIKVSSTLRMAVDCALAQRELGTANEELEIMIKDWRAFFWKEWDKENKDFEPF